jgi:NADH dehydrogenase [ubiquinone] 1 alpha subcomplex assembly factor 1
MMSLPGRNTSAEDAGPSGDDGVRVLTDFTAATPDLDWYTQNDNVMGGRSEGDFAVDKGLLTFAGSTNTNGGGFSSIRTPPFQLDLSAYAGIELRVQGDGRQYIWQLQSRGRYRGLPISYWAEFDTVDGEWTTIRIPFTAFTPNIRGFPFLGPALPTNDITEFGLYIYDKKDGPFRLQLDRVSAYRD